MSSHTFEEQSWTYAQAIKDPMVEEWINLRWHRPLAFMWIRPLQFLKKRPTPNQITLMSGLFGILSGWAAYQSTQQSAWMGVAALLLFISVILDCSDGMLARLTHQSSEIGMYLDGAVDFIVSLSFAAGAMIATMPHVHIAWGWPLILSVVPSMILHCALYDFLKNRFVFLVESKITPPPSAQRPNSGAFAWIAILYEIFYVRTSALITGIEDFGKKPDALRPDEARKYFAKPMRYASWLGLGTHLSALYLSALVAAFIPSALFYVGVGLITVSLNLWMVFVLFQWRKAEKLLQSREG